MTVHSVFRIAAYSGAGAELALKPASGSARANQAGNSERAQSGRQRPTVPQAIASQKKGSSQFSAKREIQSPMCRKKASIPWEKEFARSGLASTNRPLKSNSATSGSV